MRAPSSKSSESLSLFDAQCSQDAASGSSQVFVRSKLCTSHSSSKTGSSSCQCTTTLQGKKEETKKDVNTSHRQLRIMLANSRAAIGLSAWIRRKMVRNLFPQTRWILGWNGRRNDGKFLSIRSSDISCLQCNETIELFLRTVISTNQLIIYGAIADLCDEVPKRVRTPGKPAAPEHLEKVEIPTVPLRQKILPLHSSGSNLWQEYERKFEQLSENQKLSKLSSDAGLKLVEQGQYFFTPETEEGQQMQHLCREYTMLRNEKGTRARGWIRQGNKNRSSLEHKKFAIVMNNTMSKLKFHLYFKMIVSWVRIVNGVDRYVTGSMPTAKEEDTGTQLGETHC